MTQKRKEQLKEYLPTFLQERIGINIRRPFHCFNPNHPDANPSMSFNRNNNTIKCFSCGETYDIFSLVGVLYGLDNMKDQATKVESLFDGAEKDKDITEDIKEIYLSKCTHSNIQSTTYTKEESKKVDKDHYMWGYVKECAERIGDTNYLKQRGLSDETIKKFMLGYDPNFKGREGQKWQAVIIPTSRTSYTARNTDFSADKKERVKKYGSTDKVFNYGVIIQQPEENIFVVEGEIDAISLYEVGAKAVGIGGVGNIEKLVNLLKDYPQKKPLLIALDNDKSGQEATLKLVEELKKNKIECYHGFNLYDDCKDANELLIKDREKLENNVERAYMFEEIQKEEQKQEYLKKSSFNYIQDFLNGISQSVNTPYIPTGFGNLDKILDGGLYEGLYIVGAISSLGKTTLVTQIADQIAEGGNDVLIFSLEMARTEIMAKSISRETIKEVLFGKNGTVNMAKTTRGITTGTRYIHYSQEEKALITKAVKNYSEYAKNIYINEGIGDIGIEEIKTIIENHIKYTDKKPVVIIDYIQILAPYDIKATDKTNTDKAVLELKRLSRDYKIPVVGISSFNRDSYSNKVSMKSFKESGAIEYGSDVLIGLQLKGADDKNFDVDKEKQKDPREVELVILKNRNGATGKKVNYKYYPMFNFFEEVHDGDYR